MSRFLAPIHYWLFNKIKHHEYLEDEIVRAFRAEYGDEILEIQKNAEAEYGIKTSDDSLEDMIDLQNIHGWLKRKIGEAELRQSKIIADILKKYREDALSLLEKTHRSVGAKYGAIAKESLGQEGVSSEGIYKALNDYIVDGMPCDNVRQIVSNDDKTLKYVQVQCLHLPYWKEVGLDEDIMYKLRADWVESFVEALSPNHSYDFSREAISGRDGQAHSIYRMEK